MKSQLLKLTCGLALLGAVISASAQSTMDITGTGSGTLNGVGFSNASFDWTLTFSTDNPYIGLGVTDPVFTTLTSQISLGGGPVINVTGSPGTWIKIDPSFLCLAPMVGIPGGNILGIYGAYGLPDSGWDGATAVSYANPDGSFSQFNDIATDQGSLTMSSGSVSLVTITGVAPVPEPTTLALAGLGGLGMLWQLRRRK